MIDRTAPLATQAQQLFDAKAPTWSSKYRPDGRLEARLTRLMDALTHRVSAGASVLDLGCGTGELARAAAATGMRVTGCDISPEMLARAAETDVLGRVEWVRLEPGWRSLPFAPQEFDVVIASSVLEYVEDPVAVLCECRRVLRPRGVLLCTVPNPRHPTRWVEFSLRIAAHIPPIFAVSRKFPRLHQYLTYLRISRNHHSFRRWQRLAVQAWLHPISASPDSERHTALTMLGFHSRESAVEQN